MNHGKRSFVTQFHLNYTSDKKIYSENYVKYDIF